MRVNTNVTFLCIQPDSGAGAPQASYFLFEKIPNFCQGIISMCQGATTNYAGLLATRFFLGLAEAGFYPGVL